MATRVNQRERTRRAIIDAALELLEEGEAKPTMEAVAARAQVSRATAYRYFDTASDAVWQGVVDRKMPPVDETVGAMGGDVVERALRAEELNNGLLLDDLDGSRTVERMTLDRVLGGRAQPGDRPARRLRYIDAALEPIADSLGDDAATVRNALALTMGTHVVGALIDTCRLDVDEAREACRFAVTAIVEAALARVDAAD